MLVGSPTTSAISLSLIVPKAGTAVATSIVLNSSFTVDVVLDALEKASETESEGIRGIQRESLVHLRHGALGLLARRPRGVGVYTAPYVRCV